MPRIPPELSAQRHPDDGDPIVHLSQADRIRDIEALGCGEWTTLYEHRHEKRRILCSYSALISQRKTAKSLKRKAWDLRIGGGMPGFTQRICNGKEITTYDRFGMSGVEPLLHCRDFHGIKPRQFDFNEDFRLFHNLYHDREHDRYIFIDASGNETIAAEVRPGLVQVLTRLLRQYMAARQLALAFFFHHTATVDVDLTIAKPSLPRLERTTTDLCYEFAVGEADRGTVSNLIGKKIIRPAPISECGVWPYDSMHKEKFVEFMIGVDERGAPVSYSCDPNGLSNYFGSNEHAPHYLTPVWFKREVLSKYYDQPNRFSVEDGYLRCGSLWGLRIDNNLPDDIVVYLGDLGSDLGYDEQLYWRHYNVTKTGKSTSETNFRRSFNAEFAEPSASDLGSVEIHLEWIMAAAR